MNFINESTLCTDCLEAQMEAMWDDNAEQRMASTAKPKRRFSLQHFQES